MSAPRLLVLTLAATALAGCATLPQLPPPPVVEARTPTELWAAKVVVQPQQMQLAVRAQGPSAAQEVALNQFAADWRAGGGGPITLQAPVGGPDAASVAQASEAVRSYLAQQGVPMSDIRLIAYQAAGQPAAPLILGRQGYGVTVPECGREWTNISRSMTNEVQPNFGCAVTANMAAQIANPADLLGPSPSTPLDAQRRDVVLGRYRNGDPTSSAKDDQADGAVSTVAK